MRIVLIVFTMAGLMILGHQAMRAVGPPEGGRFAERFALFEPSRPAPLARVFTPEGGAPATLADWRGKVALVSFWATWCPICAPEMPALESLAERYGDRGLVVLAVSIDDAPAAKPVLDYLAARKLERLTPLLDSSQTLARAMGMRGTPTTLVLDRAGRIVGAVEGRGPWADETTLEWLEGLLEAGS